MTTMYRISFVNALVATILISISACREPGTTGEMREGMDTLIGKQYDKWNDRDSAQTHASPIESGIIYMQSTQPIRGSDVERTVYFDDYGRKRYTETVTK